MLLLLLVILQGIESLKGRVSLPKTQNSQSLASSVLIIVKSLESQKILKKTHTLPDGTFEIDLSALPDDSYHLQVSCPFWLFKDFRVLAQAGRITVKEFFSDVEARVPLLIPGIREIRFSPEKEKFDVLQFLKNPMVLFGGGALLLMTFMSRIQKSLGEEADVKGLENKAAAEIVLKLFHQD